MTKEQMFAEVILGSSHPSPSIPPIYTIHCRYPRFIHSEIMTHRVFSRNARSSRAVPISKIIKEVKEFPVIPWHWGKNQPGMQAFEECNEKVYLYSSMWDDLGGEKSREDAWLTLAEYSIEAAEEFAKSGYHKQIVNRLLEPFMWIDTLITSTEWNNFFELRLHKDAEPHIQDLALLIKKAIEDYKLQKLEENGWHLPYISDKDKDIETLLKISAARCARISYKAFEGEDNTENDIRLFDKLISSKPMHASPVEHQAQASSNNNYNGNFHQGWKQWRKILEYE